MSACEHFGAAAATETRGIRNHGDGIDASVNGHRPRSRREKEDRFFRGRCMNAGVHAGMHVCDMLRRPLDGRPAIPATTARLLRL